VVCFERRSGHPRKGEHAGKTPAKACGDRAYRNARAAEGAKQPQFAPIIVRHRRLIVGGSESRPATRRCSVVSCGNPVPAMGVSPRGIGVHAVVTALPRADYRQRSGRGKFAPATQKFETAPNSGEGRSGRVTRGPSENDLLDTMRRPRWASAPFPPPNRPFVEAEKLGERLLRKS
jgi:hypothetical protein